MELAKYWRNRAARYRLEGERNLTTGEIRFPPTALDQESSDWEAYSLSGKGVIYSFTVVRQPPAGFEAQTPYLVAMVQLEEGPMVTAQLTDCDQEAVTIGMPVEMVTRKVRDLGEDGLLIYNYKFRPVLQ